MGSIQVKRWLNLNGQVNTGWATFYDIVDPFHGRSSLYRITVGLQPSPRINESISYQTVRFNRASDGQRVFTVHIVDFRSTYQFNKQFFLRAIGQFDSSNHRVLTDLLASYELVPGTVLHAGYSSLIERRGFEDGALVPSIGNYLTVNRGLFFKASYLHRF